jgi:ABC-type sugar transport system substrate-binding protein
MTVDHSTVFALHQRSLGAQDWFEQNHPEFIRENRFFVADTSIRHWDVDTSFEVVSTVLAMNPQFERWLIFGLVDAQSVGAALALDAAGLTDTSYTAPFGAEAARLMWDAGQTSALRSAGTSSTLIFAEPVFFALYAFMMGEAEYDSLWPEWVNCRDGQTFPMRLVPFFWVNQDNYQQVFAWGDVYAGSNIFPEYSKDGIDRDLFSARVRIPDWYRCNQGGCRFCEAAAALDT